MICAGGGRIPVMYSDSPCPRPDGHQVEAVIDKELASALFAARLGADVLLIVTDVDAVCAGLRDAAAARDFAAPTPAEPAGPEYAAESIGPERCAQGILVRRADRRRSPRIGWINDTPALLRGEAGTVVARDAAGIELAGVA